MIEVIYRRKRHTLRVTGHAYSGKAGEDLVCAAASILAYTYAYAAENAKRDGLVSDTDISMEHGSARVRCCVLPEHDKTVTVILDNIVNGFILLANSYPDRVRVTAK